MIDLLYTFERQALEAQLASKGTFWGAIVESLGVLQVVRGGIGGHAKASAGNGYGAGIIEPLHLEESRRKKPGRGEAAPMIGSFP